MQRPVREVKRQIPKAHIDSIFPQRSFLDFELVIQHLQNELADEDEFKIIQPPLQLSETSYEVKLKKMVLPSNANKKLRQKAFV